MHKESLTSREATKVNTLKEILQAALDKKAGDIIVLELEGKCSFWDQFLICSGTSVRQNQSIADGINERLRRAGVHVDHIEGYSTGEWILMDYLDVVVHIFSERSREFYDLERLWPEGKRRKAEELIEQGV